MPIDWSTGIAVSTIYLYVYYLCKCVCDYVCLLHISPKWFKLLLLNLVHFEVSSSAVDSRSKRSKVVITWFENVHVLFASLHFVYIYQLMPPC